jgi:diadenosine tetraphosphate (Ap4A) HIT family hydrolase
VEDVCRAAEALQRAFRPTKINYAVLGNQSPHIHWHLIPRRADDPAWPRPVWSHPHEKQVPPPARAREVARVIREALR